VSKPLTYEELGPKATCYQGGPMHVKHPHRYGWTLCGLRWWFQCDHGERYCRNCQRVVAGLYRKSITPNKTDQLLHTQQPSHPPPGA
jgi:hypothetical protein